MKKGAKSGKKWPLLVDLGNSFRYTLANKNRWGGALQSLPTSLAMSSEFVATGLANTECSLVLL